ncbi:MAG: monovalent cation/H+ antiporter subunit D family protein [Thermodesulfobacteriota bacterium]
MAQQLPILLVVAPLMAAFLVPIVGWWNKRLCYPLAVAALAAPLVCTLGILKQVMAGGGFSYHLGGWSPPWGIEYALDYLNSFVLVIISIVSFIVTIYSKESVRSELPDKITPFYTLLLLMVTGLLGMTVSGDAFNVFVFLEISSLSCYGLIAIGSDGAPFATFRYIIMGTIGASFYLLGVGYLYLVTGTLNMADLARLLPQLYASRVVLTAGIFLLVGIGIKMALFPLHAWLPGAYTYAPSTVSAMVAPLYTKVAAYLLIRIMFTVFQPAFFIEVIPATTLLSWLAAIAMLVGSIYAIAQSDLKRMLSYSVVAQIGYIALGIGLANRLGLSGALLHILNEAFTKGCVFLVAGAIVFKLKSCRLENFNNLYRKMPFTMSAFTIGTFSMIGIPPTSGFFSKLYLLLGSVAAGNWIFVAVLLVSTLLNVVYFFRVIQLASFEKPMPDYARITPYETVAMDEVPLSMQIPIQLMAAGILLSGIFSSRILSAVIVHIIPKSFTP